MKEWLKDHVLELASLVVAIVGVKGLTDFWSRLCELFTYYTAEAIFACALSMSVVTLISIHASRWFGRKKLAAKDAECDKKLAEKDSECSRKIELFLHGQDIKDMAGKVNAGEYYERVTLRIISDDGHLDMWWIEQDAGDTYDDMFEPIDLHFIENTNDYLEDLEAIGAVKHKAISGWTRRWVLTEDGTEMVSRHPDTVDVKGFDVEATRARVREVCSNDMVYGKATR